MGGWAILMSHRLMMRAIYSVPAFDRVTYRARNKKTKEKEGFLSCLHIYRTVAGSANVGAKVRPADLIAFLGRNLLFCPPRLAPRSE